MKKKSRKIIAYCIYFLLLSWAACWQLYKKTNIFLQLQLKIECVIVWIAFVSQSLMREKLSSIYANIYTLNVYHLAPLAFQSLALGSEVNFVFVIYQTIELGICIHTKIALFFRIRLYLGLLHGPLAWFIFACMTPSNAVLDFVPTNLALLLCWML